MQILTACRVVIMYIHCCPFAVVFLIFLKSERRRSASAGGSVYCWQHGSHCQSRGAIAQATPAGVQNPLGIRGAIYCPTLNNQTHCAILLCLSASVLTPLSCPSLTGQGQDREIQGAPVPYHSEAGGADAGILRRMGCSGFGNCFVVRQ